MRNIIYHHNVLQPWPLPDQSVDCIVTSPPYWGLRDYGTAKWEGGDPDCDHQRQVDTTTSTLGGSTRNCGNKLAGYGKKCGKCGAHRVDDQLGQEETPELYVEHLVQVFTEAYRVLKPTGSLWLNLGDTYWGGKGQSGGAYKGENTIHGKAQQWANKGDTRPQDRRHPDIKPKDLVGIPWLVAFALRSAGWYLRSEIVWAKPNCMPESVSDRPTRSHEQIFLLTKQRDYYYDAEAIKEPLAASSVTRLQQNVEAQVGTTRAYGKTNGNLKAQGDLSSGTRNKRDVWTVPPGSFDGEYCTACGSYFDGPTKRRIREWVVTVEGELQSRVVKYCTCGRADAWLSHFATFPPDLITDCIKAGSSQHGNCAKCGSPWERKTETIYKHHEKWFGEYQTARNSGGSAGNSYNEPLGTMTTGWQPTCSCGTTEVVPAIVLDCFMGSGTTALTARQLGRDFVGLDLNHHYIAMARARLREGQQAELTF